MSFTSEMFKHVEQIVNDVLPFLLDKKELTNAYLCSEVVVDFFFMILFSVLVRHFCVNMRFVYTGKLKHFMSVIFGFLCLDLAALVGLKANLDLFEGQP